MKHSKVAQLPSQNLEGRESQLKKMEGFSKKVQSLRDEMMNERAKREGIGNCEMLPEPARCLSLTQQR